MVIVIFDGFCPLLKRDERSKDRIKNDKQKKNEDGKLSNCFNNTIVCEERKSISIKVMCAPCSEFGSQLLIDFR